MGLPAETTLHVGWVVPAVPITLDLRIPRARSSLASPWLADNAFLSCGPWAEAVDCLFLPSTVRSLESSCHMGDPHKSKSTPPLAWFGEESWVRIQDGHTTE